jgi:phytoene dehydrogenase-like protein
MDRHWDVIVIGAGIGGLTAAARMGKEGLRVLVLEKARHPGGTAYIYDRKRYSFPMGPLGFSNPDLVKDALMDIGVKESLELNRVHYKLRAFGHNVTLSLPFQELARELTALYPLEGEGIRVFFDDMLAINSVSTGFSPQSLVNVPKNPDASASAYLQDLIDDWRLRRILGSMGTREPYSGLPLLAAMWILLSERGIYYPQGGMKMLCDILARRMDGFDDNTSLRLNAEVVELRVEGGRACGVTLADGSILEARAVVSNADYKSTFLRLVPRGAVPAELHNELSKAPQATSKLQVCLGFDPTGVDLSAFSGASRIIYRRGSNGESNLEDGPDWKAHEVDPEVLAGQELEIDLLSADDPSLAPRERAVLLIRVSAEHRHFTRFRPAWRKRGPGYIEYKNRLAKALISETSNLAPGLADAVEIMDVATPLTFEERGGRSDGAVAGWSWDYLAEHDPEARELVLTPIAGLYMAGYQAFSMLSLGGVPSAMRSGILAARYVLEKAGPVKSVAIPGSQSP